MTKLFIKCFFICRGWKIKNGFKVNNIKVEMMKLKDRHTFNELSQIKLLLYFFKFIEKIATTEAYRLFFP